MPEFYSATVDFFLNFVVLKKNISYLDPNALFSQTIYMPQLAVK